MSDPWIRVHANLGDKPVVDRCAAALRIHPAQAAGHLVLLWGALSQHGSQGLVTSISDAQLERWAMWTGRRGYFAEWLRQHHVDSDGRINEWNEYHGVLERRRQRDRNYQATRRRASGEARAHDPGDVVPSVGTTSRPARANETIRDDTNTAVVDDSERAEFNGVVSGEPQLTASWLTIWANRAISERWGGQPAPLTIGSHAHELAGTLVKAGTEAAIARLSIYHQCRESKLERPPRSINYFRPGIEADWQKELARRALVASGEQPPPSEQALRDRRDGRGRSPYGRTPPQRFSYDASKNPEDF